MQYKSHASVAMSRQPDITSSPLLQHINCFFFENSKALLISNFEMKFFIAIAAVLATISLAAPADDTEATVNTALQSANTYGQGGPAPNNCYWNGAIHFCVPECDEPYFETKQDPCGDSDCCTTGFKVLCCKHN